MVVTKPVLQALAIITLNDKEPLLYIPYCPIIKTLYVPATELSEVNTVSYGMIGSNVNTALISVLIV